MSNDLAQPFVEALGQTLNLELSLPPSGELAFELDGQGLFLQWNETLQTFTAYVEAAPLLGPRSDETCRRLLSSNFLLAETQGAALSYNPETNMVGLNYAIPLYGLSPEDFIRALDNLVVLADTWKETLTRIKVEQEEETQAALDALDREEEWPEGLPQGGGLLRV